MKLYLDTEFNGHGGDLISMALIGIPQQHSMVVGGFVTTSWYEARLFNGPIDPWVERHVMGVLNARPLMPKLFKRDFHDFIRQFRDPEIICDWHADAEWFCRMLEGDDYGSSLDFACTIRILNTPPNVIVSATPHNALADATALRDWCERRLAA